MDKKEEKAITIDPVVDNKSEHDDFHHPNEANLDNMSAPPSMLSHQSSVSSHSDGNTANDGTVLIDGKKPVVPENISAFKRFLFRLDYHYLKPCLIYKYSYKKQIKDDQFFDQFEKGASELKRMHFIVKQETMTNMHGSASGAANSYQYGSFQRRPTLSAN